MLKTFSFFIFRSRISSVSFKLKPHAPPFTPFAAHGPQGGHLAHFWKPWFKCTLKIVKADKKHIYRLTDNKYTPNKYFL